MFGPSVDARALGSAAHSRAMKVISKPGAWTENVTFVGASGHIDEQLDAAYRTKYHRYAANIVGSILTPEARSSTIKLVPR